MTPESSPAASSDGPWHPPSAAAATSRRSSVNSISRRSSIDSQATAATVVSASVEPLKTERRRSSNVSFERSPMAFSEEILGLGLSDDEDDENYDAERSIFLSPTASSLGPSGNEQRRTSGRRGSATSLQPSRGRFLGHWRRGRRRGSTSSLPSSFSAATANASQGNNIQSPPSTVGFFAAADEGAGNRGSSSDDGNDLRRDIRAALRNLDDADIDDQDGEEDDEAIARTVERLFGNGDVSSGGGGGNNGRISRTIQMEVHTPPPQGAVPRRSSLKSQENRRDWSHRS